MPMPATVMASVPSTCDADDRHRPRILLAQQQGDGFGREGRKRGEPAEKAGGEEQPRRGRAARRTGRTAPSATPISRPPSRFAPSVPSGRVGNSGLSSRPSAQRSTAPRKAPAPTASNEVRSMRIRIPVRVTRVRTGIGALRQKNARPPREGFNQASSALRRFEEECHLPGNGLHRSKSRRRARQSHAAPTGAGGYAGAPLPLTRRCLCRHVPRSRFGSAQPALAAGGAVDDRPVLDRRRVSGVPADRRALRRGRHRAAAADQRVPGDLRRDEPVPRRDFRCDRAQAGDHRRHAGLRTGLGGRGAVDFVRDAAGMPCAAGRLRGRRPGGGARGGARFAAGRRRRSG